MAGMTFADLPDSARIWIYGAQRRLTNDEILALTRHLRRFLSQWNSHEQAVVPGWQLMHEQFVIIGVDEAAVNLSGCSIDSMVRTLGDFNRISGLNFSNSGNRVFYREPSGTVRCVDRPVFKDLARQNIVNEDTIVFNNVIGTVGELRARRWEVPLRDSWHMDAFGPSMTTS